MPEAQLDRLVQSFRDRFGGRPRGAFRAPGRVNLLGEHTDYNGGFVLPMAIDRTVTAMWAPLGGPEIRLYSEWSASEVAVALPPTVSRAPTGAWDDYARGLAWALAADGVPLRGCAVLVHSRVPVGKGLASSAAFCVAVAAALLRAAGWALKPERLALVCQNAERVGTGVACGIMDQFAAALSRGGTVLWIDCTSNRFEHVPIDEGRVRIVVADSRTRHTLAEGGYNARRQELEDGLAYLRRTHGISSARQLRLGQLEELAAELPGPSVRRLRHALEENARVEQSVLALRTGAHEALGKLMLASHKSLREQYEVSTPELDALVEAAIAIPGCLGAKLTGAGFGGATVNLVRTEQVERFCQRLGEEYRRRTGLDARPFECRSAGGVSEIAVPQGR